MKLSFLGSGKGGLGGYTIELLNRLSKKIKNIDLYLMMDDGSLMNSQFHNNIKIHRMSENPIISFIKSIFIINRLRKSDIIHTDYAIFGLVAYITKLIFKKPYIYVSHGYPDPKYELGIFNKIAYSIEKILFPIISKNADCYVTISNYTKRLVYKKHNIKAKVIYQGVDNKKFTYNNIFKNKIRKKLNFNINDKIILFVGRLNLYKDPLTLVDSILELTKFQPKIKLLLIGDGELKNKIENRIIKMKLLNNILILSKIPYNNMPYYYNAVDIFVIPSLNEHFGKVVVEAMACGLPVITTNSGAFPEIVNGYGLLFKKKNVKDLTMKIKEVLKNENYYKKRALKAIPYISKNFTWEKNSQEYYNLYKKLIKGDN